MRTKGRREREVTVSDTPRYEVGGYVSFPRTNSLTVHLFVEDLLEKREKEKPAHRPLEKQTLYSESDYKAPYASKQIISCNEL